MGNEATRVHLGGAAAWPITTKYRRAACYIDRILKSEKLADLPVQAPTKYVGTSSLSKEKCYA